MALTLTQDQIKKLISVLEKSSTPITTTELVTTLKR
jgi:transcriptional regulator of NAD metabolism